MAVTIIVKNKLHGSALIRRPEGGFHSIPTEGWHTAKELEREIVEAAEYVGADLSKENNFEITESRNNDIVSQGQLQAEAAARSNRNSRVFYRPVSSRASNRKSPSGKGASESRKKQAPDTGADK